MLATFPVQALLDVEPVPQTDSHRDRIHSERYMGDRWFDKQDHLPTGTTTVPVLCASNMTPLADSSDDQHNWLLYLTIGNIWKDISLTSKKRTWLLIRLILLSLRCVKKIHNALRSAIGTVLPQPWPLVISGPGLKWDWADWFQQQYYPLLAAWVGDYPEEVMVAIIAYGSCPICEFAKGTPMGHSTFWPLDILRDQHIHSELLEDNNIDAIYTLGVYPIHNQFWQYTLCNVNWLWQPDEFHQLLLGLVKDLLHGLRQYPKAGNVKDQFDIRFTSVPQYPSLQYFFVPFDSLKRGTW